MKADTVAKDMVSGDWHVRPGSEDEFVKRWTEFLDWTRASARGFRGARLIRDTEDGSHFLSFAEWDSDEARQAWRGLPDFPLRLGACRALCEDMRGVNYDLVVAI
jgi:quinol monooxygenase YgiN